MNFFVFDTETTGLEPGSRMVELCAVMLDDQGQECQKFQTLVNPNMPIPPDVSAIHGITNADVAKAPGMSDALHSLRAWLDLHANLCMTAVGVAHNAPFDMGVMSWCMGRIGMPLPTFPVIDTCAMARTIKATKGNSLAALVESYSIARNGDAHRAYSDCDATRQYFNIARTLTEPVMAQWATGHTYTDVLPPALKGLPDAVMEGAPLSFGYTDAQGARTDRTVTPYGWAMTPTGVLFHGLCHLRNERRSFKAASVAA
jgi:DNA polymerase-3 subunit epsilon